MLHMIKQCTLYVNIFMYILTYTTKSKRNYNYVHVVYRDI